MGLKGLLEKANIKKIFFFKPKKSFEKGSKQYRLHQTMKATLGAGNLMMAVKLPRGENPFDWISINTVDFFNQISLLYGAVSLFCTPQSCTTMCAGKTDYLWQDKEKYRTPTKMSAPEYCEHLMEWIRKCLDNPKIFPANMEKISPKLFTPTVKTIFKRLFRVYAHMYHHHMHQLKDLNIDAHFNTGFKHFFLFVRENDLIQKREYQPMTQPIEEICKEYYV